MTSLAYRSAGSGQPVIFVHGWGLDSLVWLEQLKGLSDCFRIIAVDLPGHGATPPYESTLTITAAARLLAEFIDELELETVHLVGWSLGAQVVCFAALHADNVRSLTIVNGTPCFAAKQKEDTWAVPLTKAKWTLRELEKNFINTLTEFITTSFYTKKELKPQTGQTMKTYFFAEHFPPDKKSALELLTDLIETDLRPALGSSLENLPCLICHGDRDSILPLEVVKVWENLLPSSRKKIFKNCGHAPFITQPAAFNESLGKFLKSI
ncbi:MAG: O-methylpimelyl-ACP methylesterase [bacterium]|nr:MAG: O-methylpimelyl-ACP methylesterase [bacterium]